MSTTRNVALSLLAIASVGVMLAACERQVELVADPAACRSQARTAMVAALARDGDFSGLPVPPDRSMGIAACTGLSVAQLDDVSAQLQVDLAPAILAASAKHATDPVQSPR